MKPRLAYPIFFLSAIGLWYAVCWLTRRPPTVLPLPHQVLILIAQEWPRLLQNTSVTLGTALIGYLFANLIAILCAIGFFYVRTLKELGSPWVIMLKNLPIVSIASLLIITFGDSMFPRILVVVLVCFHPILANLLKGFEQVDPNLIARFQTLHANRWELFRYVLWPNALPYYAAAHEVAFTSSIIGAVLGEFFFARQGLGFLLTQSMNDYRGDRLWAVNGVITLLSTAAYGASIWLEKKLTPWRQV
jgi:NitT/TauT family transport system permease protein